MEDDTTANDRARATQTELAVGDVENDSTVRVGNDVAEVTGVANLVLGSTVGLVERVVVSTGGETALARDVAELVDVETVGRGGLKTGDLKVSIWLGVLMISSCYDRGALGRRHSDRRGGGARAQASTAPPSPLMIWPSSNGPLLAAATLTVPVTWTPFSDSVKMTFPVALEAPLRTEMAAIPPAQIAGATMLKQRATMR